MFYKFLGYVEWPPEAAGATKPIVFGVAGDRAVADELEQAIADKNSGGRPLRVRRLASGADACDDCHVLYIGRDVEPGQRDELLRWSRGKPVLTVTEAGGGATHAGVIQFALVEERVRFDVFRDAAEANHLRLAAPLLAVARNVRGSP